MTDKNYPETIHLTEQSVTYGCYYTIPGEPPVIHYGFSDLLPESGLWLAGASGAAVEQLLAAGVGKTIKETPGVYGGICKTIEVHVAEMEKVCKQYWDRTNAAHEKVHGRQSCHYCGGTPVTGFDLFDAPHCQQCK